MLDLVEGYPGEGTLYIGLLELEVQFHRQGLGTRLVRALKTAAQKAGFSSLRLGCYERNAPGLAFWNAMGFEKEGEVLREGRALYKNAPLPIGPPGLREPQKSGIIQEHGLQAGKIPIKLGTVTDEPLQRLSRCLRQQRPPIVKKGRKKGVDKI